MRKLPSGDYVLDKSENSLSFLREYADFSKRRKALEDALGVPKVLDMSTYYPFGMTSSQVEAAKGTGFVEFAGS